MVIKNSKVQGLYGCSWGGWGGWWVCRRLGGAVRTQASITAGALLAHWLVLLIPPPSPAPHSPPLCLAAGAQGEVTTTVVIGEVLLFHVHEGVAGA